MAQPTDNKQLRVYDSQGTFKRFSVDELIAQGKNKWKNWHCSAGARNLYIDYDGNVWVANCASSAHYSKVHAKRVDDWQDSLRDVIDAEWKAYREGIIGTDAPYDEVRKKWLNENTEGGWPMPKVDYKNSEQQHKLMAEIARLEKEFFKTENMASIGERNNKYYKDFLNNTESWRWRADKDSQAWGLLGSIYTDWKAPTDWLRCPYSSCGCGADVILSKGKDSNAVNNLHVTNHQHRGQDMGTEGDIVDDAGVEMNFPIVHQILWDITRRCNYDCSYCWPSVHNNMEPHHKYDNILRTINKAIDEWSEGDEIRWNFGGGEPTMHPQFMKILETLHGRQQWVLVTTNGSRSTKFWSEAVQYINSINMSAHFGSMDLYPGNEERFIENCALIIDYHKRVDKDHWLEIKLMTPPGFLDRAVEFRNKIQDLGLNDKGANGRQIGAISLVPIRGIEDASQLVDYSGNELEYFKAQ